MSLVMEISENLQNGRAKAVKELVLRAVEEGVDVKDILENGLMHGMGIIGTQFKNDEIFVPEVLVAARAMNMGVAALKPYLQNSEVHTKGKICLGTVRGDMHDIGKNLVKLMMESKGFEVIDLGVDVPVEKFVEAIGEYNCDIVACSALLTTTMGAMREVVQAIENAGLRNKVKIMIGGAPVTEAFCRQIGADVYTPDAASAAETAVLLLSNK